MSTTDTRAAFEAWWESEPDEDKFTFDELALMRRAWNAAIETTKATCPVDFPEGSALKILRDALWFYADKEHFIQHQDVWESVSGEPENFLEDESHTATVEDGTVAKNALNAVAGYTGAKATCTAGELPEQESAAEVQKLRIELANAVRAAEGFATEAAAWRQRAFDAEKHPAPSVIRLAGEMPWGSCIDTWLEVLTGEEVEAEFMAYGNACAEATKLDMRMAMREATECAAEWKAKAEAARQPAPVDDNDAFKEAYMIWSRKTDWVQEQISSFPPSALGKHRADVMREEIERLRAALAATAAPVLSDEQIDRMAGRNGLYAAMTPDDRTCKSMVKRFVTEILDATRSQP